MRLTLLLLLAAIAVQLPSQSLPAVPANCAAYMAAHPDPPVPSRVTGTPSGGTLSAGCLMPFIGPNFLYFDTTSYLQGRAFVDSRVKAATLAAYDRLATDVPGRWWGLMECSKQKGGRIWPHRTHQNGRSIDFMVPLVRDGQAYYALDTIGLEHYLLEFDAQARLATDAAVSVDLDLVARHILALHASAKAQGLKITKVIIKLEWKEALYATPHGKLLKASGIYLASELTSLINGLHDNHYHVDFGG
jgi:penicillin-insensitive murein endopeptidase